MKNSLKVGDTVTVNAFTAPGKDSTFLFTCTVKKISSGGEYFVANEHEPHFGYNTFKVSDIIPETPKAEKPMKWFLGSVNCVCDNFGLSVQGTDMQDAVKRLEHRLIAKGYRIQNDDIIGRSIDSVWFWGYYYNDDEPRKGSMPFAKQVASEMREAVCYISLTPIEILAL